ncbi:MAG: hypothetical protein ACRYGF_08735 [Janthinobacterium lividum]
MLGSYQDDFFYYLKVAQNIAATGSSTFNGINLTNGYHPLWMATLVVLCRLFHGTAFFVALQAVSLASAVATYALMVRILRFYLGDVPARCGAFVLGMEALMLIRYGMEVTLTLPLAMLLIYLLLRGGMPSTFSNAAKLGAVASLLILSRLDAGLLVGLLCIALLLPPFRAVRTPKVLLGFVCGVAPLLLLYFVLNLHFFHLLTPVSGLAKQMKTGLSLSPETWEALRPTDRMRRIVLLPELLLIGTGLIAGLTRRSAVPADVLRTRLLWVLLLFPLLHLCTLSLLSDWTVWPWYFYSLTVAALAAYVLLVDRLPMRGVVFFASVYAGVLVLYAAAYAWKGPNSVTVLQSSMQVAGYMDAHPGVYMMGDQAGTTAFLSHQPIIQTEGLVMDKRFLQLMKAKTPLSEIAVDYRAAYYAKIGGEYRGDCLYVAEPANAGPTSPVMRGTICHAPLVVFYRTADNVPIRVFEASWIR